MTKRWRVPSVTVLAVATVLAFGAMACGKPAFTDAVARRYNLSPGDLQRIQFYTSDEIVLRRELTDQDKTVAGNELTIRDGMRIEEVVIPSHTPCVAIRVEGDFLLVSFSRTEPSRSLWFAVKRNDQTEGVAGAKTFDLIQLANPPNEAPDASGFKPDYAKGFLVTYNARKYRVVDGKMWGVHLLYDLAETFAKEKVTESPPGFRLKP